MNGCVYIGYFIILSSAHALHRHVGLRGIEQTFAGYGISSPRYQHARRFGVLGQGHEKWETLGLMVWLGLVHTTRCLFYPGLDYASDPRYENGHGSERIESFLYYWTVHRIVDATDQAKVHTIIYHHELTRAAKMINPPWYCTKSGQMHGVSI
jgi:hypothetical protein